MNFSRVWAMPSADTFSIPEIEGFVRKYLMKSSVSVDPFARNCRLATHTNDLNPNTAADYHMDAEEFCATLLAAGVKADLVIFDPPYSPRQIKECYDSFGKDVAIEDTQMVNVRRGARNALAELLVVGGIALSFGWTSCGFGHSRNFETVEILLCCHGSGHNDTICMAERKVPNLQGELLP